MVASLTLTREPDRPCRPAAWAGRLAVALLLLAGGLARGEEPAAAAPTEVTAAAEASGIPAPEALDGLPIVRIVFVSRDIFDTSDPDTAAWPYRLANSLHVTSTERFLRRMLLFSEGDLYHDFDAEESARILRSTGLVNPVFITAREVPGGVEVVVDTRERWTLEIGARFGLAGNRSYYAISVDENNLMGNGQALNLKFKEDSERSSWVVGVADPNILGSRIRTRLQYESATDGHENLLELDSPFYSLATRRAWGLRWLDTEHQAYLYSESDDVVEGTETTKALRLWGGLRLPGSRRLTQRLTAGYDYRKDTYHDWAWQDGSGPFPAPDGLEVSGPRVGYEWVVDDFVVIQGFRSWVSQEDVAMGPILSAGLTWSLPALGGDRDRVLVDGAFTIARQLGDWMLLVDAWSSGRVEDGGVRDAVFGSQVVFSEIGDRAWLARLLVETSHELDGERQLALGADLGLRGWDPDYFDGTGRVVANLQWRMKLWDNVLNLFSVGMVAFVDGGTTWGARVGPGSDRVHGDVGVGLVADVPQIGLVKLLRLEVAFPDDGSGYTTIITTRSLF